MDYFGQGFTGVFDAKAADRAASRDVLVMTVLSIIAVVSVTLMVGWAGLSLPFVDEDPPTPGLEQGMGGP